MRGSIRCLLVGTLALAALRYVGSWTLGMPLHGPAGTGWYGALSFALAAVVDTDRSA